MLSALAAHAAEAVQDALDLAEATAAPHVARAHPHGVGPADRDDRARADPAGRLHRHPHRARLPERLRRAHRARLGHRGPEGRRRLVAAGAGRVARRRPGPARARARRGVRGRGLLPRPRRRGLPCAWASPSRPTARRATAAVRAPGSTTGSSSRCTAADGSRLGFIWADEPEDRLLPSRPRLQALRLFANQATAAVVTARAVEELRFLADHDPLTRLGNRRAFTGRLGEESYRASRYGQPFALVLLDLDDFKVLNDRHGHAAGDAAPRRGGRRPAARAAALGPRLPAGGRRVRAAAGPQRPHGGRRARPSACARRWRRWTSAASRRRGRRSASPWAAPGRSTPRRSCATPTTRSTPPSARSAPPR